MADEPVRMSPAGTEAASQAKSGGAESRVCGGESEGGRWCRGECGVETAPLLDAALLKLAGRGELALPPKLSAALAWRGAILSSAVKELCEAALAARARRRAKTGGSGMDVPPGPSACDVSASSDGLRDGAVRVNASPASSTHERARAREVLREPGDAAELLSALCSSDDAVGVERGARFVAGSSGDELAVRDLARGARAGAAEDAACGVLLPELEPLAATAGVRAK